VPELCQEVVAVVAAHQVMRDGDSHGCGDGQRGVGPLRKSLQALSHERDDPGQSPDDLGRLDVDHPETRIRLLVLDDDTQRSVESLAGWKAGGRFCNCSLVILPLPHDEAVEQFALVAEVPVQGGPGDLRLQRDLGKAEPRPAIAAEHLSGGGQNPLTGGVIGVHHRSFTNLPRSVTLTCDCCQLAAGPRIQPARHFDATILDEEIGAFLILLSSAGNDTTKQTTSHTMLALANNPEQRDWLMEDFEGRITWAVEEFVRWSSPVLQFARFATEDTEIAGQEIKAGDKLGLFYCSANRDESVFAEPHTFNLQRSPNPHLGFGGGGPHFCLGNQLAKAELRNLFRELLTRLQRIEFGEPDYLLSNFVHGIKRLPAFVQ
jgi:hypothetical protein